MRLFCFISALLLGFAHVSFAQDDYYLSPKGNFKLKIPSEWVFDDMDEEGNVVFYNADTLIGVMRITTTDLEPGINLREYLEAEQIETKGSILIQLNGYPALYHQEVYLEEVDTVREQIVQHYWLTGHNQTLLVASYSILKRFQGTTLAEKELSDAKDALSTIVIMQPFIPPTEKTNSFNKP
ncbi:MAG: DUF3805 domain-containing protein [Flammeovirgaceae bacterium]|nr:DUF3805 domain-containing protein [Flammeovirgaceae bacterium]